MRRSSRSVVLGAAGAAIALTAALSGAGPASANHSWGGYHWARTSNPFTVQLGNNVSSAWTSYLGSASTDWTKSSVLDTKVVAGSTTGRKCRATAGRVEVCSAAYGSNGWLGLASISLSGSHITQGTVKMNDTYFALARYNNPSERLHVMCQEIGHTFGLDHQSETGASLGTCMDYYQNTTDDNVSTRPNAHDYDELATIYAHADLTTTVGTSTAATGRTSAGAGNDASSWGRLVQKHGRSAVYLRQLDRRHSVVTFVTLTEVATAG